MKIVRSNRSKTARTEKTARPAVVFSAGSLFFTHVTEWPQEVQGKDLAALAELALEEVSPFALESLAWGFLADAGSRSLFLFAACLPRIDDAEQEQWARASHVFPAFLPLLVARDAAGGGQTALPALELLVNGGEVVLLERDASSPWPRRMRTEPLAAAAEHFLPESDGAEPTGDAAGKDAAEVLSFFDTSTADGAACAAAVRLLVRCGIAADAGAAVAALAQIPFRQLNTATDNHRGEVRFRLGSVSVADIGVADAGGAGTVEQSAAAEENTSTDGVPVSAEGSTGASTPQKSRMLIGEPRGAAGASASHKQTAGVLQTALEGEDACWNADVRSAGFIAQARKRHRSDLVQWRILCGAAVGALVLLLVWLSFWGLGFVLAQRQRTLALQTPAVDKIRQDQDLLMRMRQFSADPFSPFGLIAGLKAGKPAAIYFDSLELQRPAEVTVDGQGPTVDAVNAYASSLVQSGRFSDARQARMSLRDGASVFTFYLQYLGEENAAAVQAAAAQSGASAVLAARTRPGARRAAQAASSGEIAQGISGEAALAEHIAELRARVGARRAANGGDAARRGSIDTGDESGIAEVDALDELQADGMPLPPDDNGFDGDEPPPEF